MVSLAASSHSMWGPTTSPRVLIASPTTAYAVHHVGVHALTLWVSVPHHLLWDLSLRHLDLLYILPLHLLTPSTQDYSCHHPLHHIMWVHAHPSIWDYLPTSSLGLLHHTTHSIMHSCCHLSSGGCTRTHYVWGPPSLSLGVIPHPTSP